jgi:hypothetical protein
MNRLEKLLINNGDRSLTLDWEGRKPRFPTGIQLGAKADAIQGEHEVCIQDTRETWLRGRGQALKRGTVNAKRELEGEERSELFQFLRGTIYKFEAMLDQETQHTILEIPNKWLEKLVQKGKDPC